MNVSEPVTEKEECVCVCVCVCVGGGGQKKSSSSASMRPHFNNLKATNCIRLRGGWGARGAIVKKENGWETKGQWRSSVKSYA